MGKYSFGELLRFLVRKCWVTVACVAFFIAALVVPDVVSDKGGAEAGYSNFCGSVIGFSNHATGVDHEDASSPVVYADYSDLWFRGSELFPFLDELSEKYDMSAFAPGWGGMSMEAKAEWFAEAFVAEQVENTPKYELAFTVNRSCDGRTESYIRENMPKVFADFVEYAGETAKIYREDTALTGAAEVTTRFEQTSSGADSPLKMGIIAVFLGGIFGVLIECVWFLAGSRAYSKRYFESEYGVETLPSGKNSAYTVCCKMIARSRETGSPLVALCSTADRAAGVAAVLGEFAELGYKTGFANLSGAAVNVPSGITALPGEVTKRLSAPGHSRELSAAAEGFDFLVVLSPAPSRDAAGAEILSSCCCAVFLEKLGVTPKRDLSRSLAGLPESVPALLSWE